MENWKVIVEYPSYSISSLGRVKNNTTNKVLKAVPNTFGYLQVRLYKEGQYKVFTIHQLVATYFLSIPSGDLELNHVDEDKLNNRWDNLEWIQHKDNCNHSAKNVRMANKLSKPAISSCSLNRITGFTGYIVRLNSAFSLIGPQKGI